MRQLASHRRGAALFLVLAFLVLICIIVVGFALSMRNDRPSASSHLDRAMASEFAQMGVETVTATLRSTTADPNRYWISQPGQLWAGASSDDTGTARDDRMVLQSNPIPLSSGVPSATPAQSYLLPPDLNITTLRDPTTHLLTDRPDASDPTSVVTMRVKWVYVRQDGTLDYSEQPNTTNATNPIIGRYAFWADDESSKINYNIAWGRTGSNTRPPADPTRISLDVLTDFTPARSAVLRNFITASSNYTTLNKGFFNTPTDARRAEQEAGGSGIAAALQQNKFEVTHFNHDPDTTFFNEPRIVLTTRPDRAGWTYNSSTKRWEGGRPYIQVLRNEGTVTQPAYIPSYSARPGTLAATSPTFTVDPLDPGFISNIDSEKVSNTLYFLMSYLQRTDWPMVNGSGSFQSKYYADYGATQASSRLAQLALNIIDYVRSKESSADFVDPIRATRDLPENAPVFTIHSSFAPIPGSTGKTSPFTSTAVPSKFSFNNAFGSESFIGLTRAPSITEMAFWLAEDRKSHISAFEIFLPRNYGIDSIDLNTLYIGAQHRPGAGDAITSIEDQLDPNALTNGNDPTKHHIRLLDGPLGSNYTSTTSATKLMAGQYVTVLRFKERPQGFNSRPPVFRLRGFLGSWGAPVGGSRWYCDMATPMDSNVDGTAHSSQIFYNTDPPTGSVPVGGDATTANLSRLTSVEVDDPRVNKSNGNWVQNGLNSMGAANSNSSLKTPANPTINPSSRPSQDVSSNGKIDTVSSLYMPPPAGRSFILSNGIVDDNTRGMVSSIGELGYIHTGVEASPWQTGQPTGVPWRTFRLQPSKQGSDVVPDWALMDLFTVPSSVDQNARQLFTPHDTSYGGRVNVNSKVEPFHMNRILPLQAVLDGAYTGNGATKVSFTAAATLADNIYNRVLAADGKLYPSNSYFISHGQIAEIRGIADEGEASEALVREIANLLTSRGDVFSVYTVGQTIKQTPAGALQVTSEQRLQAMIERYRDPLTSEIRFAPVYWRNLVP